MPELKNSNAIFWVIFKHCDVIEFGKFSEFEEFCEFLEISEFGNFSESMNSGTLVNFHIANQQSSLRS